MEGGEEYEVHVRAEKRDRRDRRASRRPRCRPCVGHGSPCATWSSSKRARAVAGQPHRRRRQVMLYANMQPGFSSQTVLDALNRKARKLKMPAAYSYGFTGRSREQGKARRAS